ncbi:MAG: hypothetical protein AAB214_09155, partial [Fibrobacterota bacterium]
MAIDIATMLRNAATTVWHLFMGAPSPTNNGAPISKTVINKLRAQPGATENDVQNVLFWFREGMVALSRAVEDPRFTVAEQVDAEIAFNHGDYSDAAKATLFADAAREAVDYEDRVRRCIAVGLAVTGRDYGALRARIAAMKMGGNWTAAARRAVAANAA